MSIVQFTIVLFLLIQVIINNFVINYIDINIVFLNPLLKKEVYIEISNYFQRIKSKLKGVQKLYLRLLKSLYGLKQASYEQYQEVNRYLASIGFTKSSADLNLYIKDDVYLLLYIDDNLLVGPRDQVDKVKVLLAKYQKYKDLEPAILFIGLQIKRDRKSKTLKIHQSSYVSRLLT